MYNNNHSYPYSIHAHKMGYSFTIGQLDTRPKKLFIDIRIVLETGQFYTIISMRNSNRVAWISYCSRNFM